MEARDEHLQAKQRSTFLMGRVSCETFVVDEKKKNPGRRPAFVRAGGWRLGDDGGARRKRPRSRSAARVKLEREQERGH